jgi:hypothetical protein
MESAGGGVVGIDLQRGDFPRGGTRGLGRQPAHPNGLCCIMCVC